MPEIVEAIVDPPPPDIPLFVTVALCDPLTLEPVVLRTPPIMPRGSMKTPTPAPVEGMAFGLPGVETAAGALEAACRAEVEELTARWIWPRLLGLCVNCGAASITTKY
jgi:hypothetical protein